MDPVLSVDLGWPYQPLLIGRQGGHGAYLHHGPGTENLSCSPAVPEVVGS